jgi:hypothetical protein
VLEAEWNTKLRELEEARAIEEQYKQSDQHQVSAEEHAEIDAVPGRFRQFWNNPQTTARQRKRAVRWVIEDVTVHKTDRIVAHIRAHSGSQTNHHRSTPCAARPIALDPSRHASSHGSVA